MSDRHMDEGDALHTELAEIDENLVRAELTPAQRAASISRRKEIWEVLHPEKVVRVETVKASKLEVGQFVPPQDRAHGGARPQSQAFAAETAKLTSESKRDINRHIARAEALGPDIHEVVGTSLDKGVELDAPACALPSRQPSIVRCVSRIGERG